MLIYWVVSHVLLIMAGLFFVASPSIKVSNSYVAAGCGGFVMISFVVLIVAIVNAAISGFLYLSVSPNGYVKGLSIFEGLLPVLIFLGFYVASRREK